MLKIKWDENKITYLVLRIILITFTIFSLKFFLTWDETVAGFKKYIGILSPFLLGFLIAFLINPSVTKVDGLLNRLFFNSKKQYKGDEKKLKKKIRSTSILITYSIVIFAIIIIMRYVLPQLSESLYSLFNDFPTVITDLSETLAKYADDYFTTDIDTINEFVKNYIPTVVDTVKSFISYSVPQILDTSISITSNIFDIIMAIIISVYLIAEKERFILIGKKIVYALFKKDFADKTLAIGRECNTIFKRFFIGKSLDSLIIGFLCFILMNLFQFPYPLVISVMVGITNMIPYFGPFIGAIPSFIIILFSSPIKALWFIVFILGLQQFDGIILGPKILGDSVGIRPIWIIFAIIIGGGLFGFIGMLLGVPTFTVIYNLTKRFINRKLVEKNISSEDIA